MPTPREAYVNSVERQGYSNARLRPADFSSGAEEIGRAAQRFGNELSRTADTVDKIQERDAAFAAQEADNIRMAKRLQRFYEGPEGYFNQEGRNALVDQEQLEKDLARIDAEAAQVIAHKPRAKQMYDQLTLKRNSDDLPRIYQHAQRERVKYEDTVDADAMDLAIDNAATSEDPAIIEENIATVGSISERVARRKGMTDENSIKQARQSGIGKAVESIAKKLELQSPSEAQAFVVLHADQMDPQDAAKLLEGLAGNAAQERAGTDIKEYLVTAGGSGVQVANPRPEAGETPTGPTPIPPEAALEASQWHQESGGKHTNASGGLTQSEGGALGISQVMPATGGDPGYGVKPLQNNSREEYIRFGNDLRRAYTKHFNGNIVLGLTAYNWGPGNVEDHIKRVGDPSKGEISDAAFLASIPGNDRAAKDARKYAPEILNRTGVKVSGQAGPSAGQPVQVGAEIDLDATINNIRNSDRPFVEKQALIAEATRLHSYGRQVKAEAEEAMSDRVYTHINQFEPGEFTDFDKQLPLDLRNQLHSNPKLEMQIRNEAASNKKAKESAAITEARQQELLAITNMRYADPEAFLQLDINKSPNLTTVDKQQALGWQQAERKARESGGASKFANHDAMRTMVNRMTDKANQPKNVGLAYAEAIRREEAWIEANGKPVPDTVREGIARDVMTKYTVYDKGGWFGSERKGKTVRGYELPTEKARLGPKYSRATVDSFEAIKAQLEQVWGRIPTDAEVQAEIEKRTTDKGLRL